MKIISSIRAAMLAVFLVICTVAVAQSGMGKYQQLYANGAIETASGVVQSIDLVVPPGVKTQAVYLTLKTQTQTIPVQLGPESFVNQLGTRIEIGDKIEVTGSRVTVEGKSLMLAAQIKKGSQTLVFRNSSGVPVWSGK
jgi:hypothetical protein